MRPWSPEVPGVRRKNPVGQPSIDTPPVSAKEAAGHDAAAKSLPPDKAKM